MTDGTWSAQDCFKSKPYVCSLAPSTLTTTSTTTTPPVISTTTYTRSCPSEWSYFNFTGYCYNVFHNQNEIGAEQVCEREGGHLVSIHSQQENNFVGSKFL